MLHSDIYLHQNTLWLSQRLIQERCGVSDTYLRKRRSIYNDGYWRWTKHHGRFYYDHDRLPDRKPTYYRSTLGTRAELMEQWQQVRQADAQSQAAIHGQMLKQAIDDRDTGIDHLYYLYDSPICFPPTKARELSRARTWLSYLYQISQKRQFAQLGISSIRELYDVAADVVGREQLEGLKVKTAGALRNKVDGYPAHNLDAARQYLVSGRYNNSNAAQVGKMHIVDTDTGETFEFDIHQALMYNGYMNPGSAAKTDMRYSYLNHYVPAVEGMDIKPIAYRTYTYHLGKWINRLLASRERHGKDYWRKNALTYVPSEHLQYSHSLLAGDGSGMLYYKYTDSKGQLRSMKLFVMLISDIASRKVLGYAAAPPGSHKETPEMVEAALKMTVERTNRKTLFEFVSDNHGAFTGEKSRKLLDTVFNQVRTITPGNSQANPAEVSFRLFKHSLKHFENFVSSSWDTGIEGKGNPDYLDIDQLPTYQEALTQFAGAVESWNHSRLPDGTSINERYANNQHPACQDLSQRAVRRLFGFKTEIDASLYRGFVRVYKQYGYERKQYLYEIQPEDIPVVSAAGTGNGAKVKVYWDDEVADLYDTEGSYLVSCQRARGAANSHAEAFEGSDNTLGHHLQRKEKFERLADKFEAETRAAIEALGSNGMPYVHAMKAGGNKESWNGEMTEEERIEKIKRERRQREFDKINKNNNGGASPAA